MSVLVSIITPCYNQGEYLEEAIQSVPYNKVKYEIEHIIVNDGSTDPFSLRKFFELEQKGFKIIHQENKGLSAARNIGISVAKGKYIVPLDADNKLHDNYFFKAIDVLEKDASIDVVYGDVARFGIEQRVLKPGDFNILSMCISNSIDACAVIRRTAFEKSEGGYDENMLLGYEDWEFWLNIFFKGARFYYLEDLGFFYRVTKNSMLLNITEPNKHEIKKYILKKYAVEIVDLFQVRLNDSYKEKKELLRFKKAEKTPFKTAIRLLLKQKVL